MNNFLKKYPAEEYFYSYYVYTLAVASIVSLASANANANVESDSVFVWQKTSYRADIAGAAQTENTRVLPLVTLQITDSGTARTFFDSPQGITSIAGHEGLPFILPAPYLFRANSTIQGAFASYDAAATYANLEVSLIGFRIYKYS